METKKDLERDIDLLTGILGQLVSNQPLTDIQKCNLIFFLYKDEIGRMSPIPIKAKSGVKSDDSAN